jgi:putative transcriptional regulator
MIVNRLEQVMLEFAAQHGRRITLRDVSQATGLAESTISRIMSGKHTRLDYSTLDKLCEYFQCQPGDLLTFVPESVDAKRPTD